MAIVYPRKQLLIAGAVAVFILYIFSVVQFFFFSGDFEGRECNYLSTCFWYTVNAGTRNGGGMGDVMRETSPYDDLAEDGSVAVAQRRHWYERIAYDLLFFIVIIIIVLNIVFGI